MTLGYFTGYQLLLGHLPAEQLGGYLLEQMVSARNGVALIGLIALLGVASELLARRGRVRDGLAYAIGAGVVAICSLLLVTGHGMHDGGRAALDAAVAYGIYGLASLAGNARYRRPAVSGIGLALLTAAAGWCLWWRTGAHWAGLGRGVCGGRPGDVRSRGRNSPLLPSAGRLGRSGGEPLAGDFAGRSLPAAAGRRGRHRRAGGLDPGHGHRGARGGRDPPSSGPALDVPLPGGRRPDLGLAFPSAAADRFRIPGGRRRIAPRPGVELCGPGAAGRGGGAVDARRAGAAGRTGRGCGRGSASADAARRDLLHRVFAKPLADTAFWASCLVLPLLFVEAWNAMAASLCLSALAAIWLTVAWTKRLAVLWEAHRVVLAAAVLAAVQAWLKQPRPGRNVPYGPLGLRHRPGAALRWSGSQCGLRVAGHPVAGELVDERKGPSTRCLKHGLVAAQLALLLPGLTAGVLTELGRPARFVADLRRRTRGHARRDYSVRIAGSAGASWPW